MSRIRSIKPIHWSDKELPKISLQAHLLWIATWNFSDDDGVFEGDPLLIKSQIFPRRTDIRVEQIVQWLDQLVKARFLIPFQYKGEGYYISRTFKTHQRIDKAQPGIIPADFLSEVLEEKNLFQEHSENVPRTVPAVLERKGIVKDDSFVPPGTDLALEYKDLEKSKKAIHEFIKNRKPDFIEPYVDFWNLFATEREMPVVKTINEPRKKKFKARIKENAFDFIEILRKAGKSDFLLTGGKWFGFDWIIENPSNYVKVLEGNYDNGKQIEEKDTVNLIERQKSEYERVLEKQKAALQND